jgi:phosphoribosylanthranilate isomerase
MNPVSSRTRIKLCGLSQPLDVAAAVAAGADAIGLVFYEKSPRHVSIEAARDLLAGLPPYVSAIGLFVNAQVGQVQDVLARVPLAGLQFHGDETPEQCAVTASATGRSFTRALRIKPEMQGSDLLEYERAYRSASPYFSALLLDTWVDAYGGSGKVFDWSLVPKELAPRVVLSGGLNALNVTEAVSRIRPHAVDVSSGIESAKGIKDAGRMHDFVRAVREADSRQG